VVLFSDSYLRSQNCMYEMLEFVQEKDYRDRIVPVIFRSTGIFDVGGRLKYIEYGEQETSDLRKKLEKFDITHVAETIREDLKHYDNVCNSIDEILHTIADTFTPVVIDESGITPEFLGEILKKVNVAPPPILPDMVLIDGGDFMMGSPESEPQRNADEGPRR